MELPVFSAYRSWSDRGMGNSPTTPLVGAGDQYLYVDREPWAEPGLPDALRPWLTLNLSDTRYRTVGDSLESWMAAPFGRWQFVGRLCSFGKDWHGRPSYFAHARGWREEDWHDPELDPGAWLGDASAFDRPWSVRPPAPSSAPRDPRVRAAKDWALLERDEHAATAAALLAHLCQAVRERNPVVCLAPLNEFLVDQPLPTLVAVARAALPFGLKKDVRLRVYADEPQFFFEEGVHLLALVEEWARLAEHHGATILEFRDGRLKGPPAKPDCVAYASAAIDGARKFPGALLRFAAVAESRLTHYVTAADGQLETAARIVYDLAVAAPRPGSHDQLLRKRLFKEALKRETALRWSDLLGDEDWKRFSVKTLSEIALWNAPSDDSAALRTLVLEKLAALGVSLDDALHSWWTADTAHAKELVHLVAAGAGCVSTGQAARLLRTLPPGDVVQVLLDPRRGPAFVGLVGKAPLPDAWRGAALLSLVPLDAARAFAVVAAEPDAVAVWQTWLDAWVRIFAWEPAIPDDLLRVPEHVHAAVADVEAALAYGELFARGDTTADRARVHMQRFLEVHRTSEQKLQIAMRCVAGDSRFLREHLPTRWLVEAIGDQTPKGLVELLDARVDADRASEIPALVEAGWWRRWAQASSASAESRLRNALAWLGVGSKQRTRADWDEVMRTLDGRLTGAWLAEFRKSHPVAPFWIRGIETEQRAMLAAAALDLGALVEIAEMGRPPSYVEVENDARASGTLLRDLPHGVVALLGKSAAPPVALTPAQCSLLLDRAGHCRSLAIRSYVRTVLPAIGRPEVIQDIERRSLWQDEQFCADVAEWIVEQAELIHGAYGEALDAIVPPREAPPRLANVNLEPIADLFLQRHLLRIAQFLVPEIAVRSMPHAAVRALCERAFDDATWARLEQLCRTATTDQPHPLTNVANALATLDGSLRLHLTQAGWATFMKALEKYPVLLEIPYRYRGPLPAFLVLFRTDPNVTLEYTALTLLHLRWRLYQQAPSMVWFDALTQAVHGATRLSGARGAGDAGDYAMARVTARVACESWSESVKELVLAHANPLKSRYR